MVLVALVCNLFLVKNAYAQQLSSQEVNDWAHAAVPAIIKNSYQNTIEQYYSGIATYFTDGGLSSYKKAYEYSKTPDALTQRKQSVFATLRNNIDTTEPAIFENGVWTAVVPIYYYFQSGDAVVKPKEYFVIIKAQETDDGDSLKITQFIMTATYRPECARYTKELNAAMSKKLEKMNFLEKKYFEAQLKLSSEKAIKSLNLDDVKKPASCP